MIKGRLKVSLILTYYNFRHNLVGTLDSILRQNYGNLEIVDGVSRDESVYYMIKVALAIMVCRVSFGIRR